MCYLNVCVAIDFIYTCHLLFCFYIVVIVNVLYFLLILRFISVTVHFFHIFTTNLQDISCLLLLCLLLTLALL